MELRTVLLLAVIAALVLIGSRLSFGRRRLPLGVRETVQTGTAFLVLGALLGPHALNLVTERVLEQLGPVIVIGLGWIGFLYGTHFEWRLVRRLPRAFYGVGFTESLVSLGLVAGLGAVYLGLVADPGSTPDDLAVAALVLGVCAAGTAPAGTYLLTTHARLRHADSHALQFFAAVDDLPALLILGFVYAFFHPSLPEGGQVAGWQWALITVGMGLLGGWLMHLVFPRGTDVRVNALVLLGMVSLGAGAASLLRLSPLFVSVIAGMVFANLSSRKESVYGMLADREQELYVVFLLSAGALFRFDWTLLLGFAPAYIALRALAKVGGAWLGLRLFMGPSPIHPLIGSGLLFQGGLTLAIAVNLERTHVSALPHQVATIVVVAAIINDLIGPTIAARLLGRRGSR